MLNIVAIFLLSAGITSCVKNEYIVVLGYVFTFLLLQMIFSYLFIEYNEKDDDDESIL